jgi:CubicO group peptidase (beta-lactamase class C family)
MRLPLLGLLAAVGVGGGLPLAAPRDVGMSAERLAAVDRVVMRGAERRGYPGAAVVVGRRGRVVLAKGYGTVDWSDASRCVRADATIYDLASITKVVATTTAIMILYDRGRIRLDAPVVTYLPDFAAGDARKRSVTIEQLLTHRSGLPAGRELGGSSIATARRRVLTTPLEQAPGGSEIYSDIGADVLAMVAERVSGEPLDRFLQRNVFGPLGMSHTFFRPSPSVASSLAPTTGRPHVHDGNAWALGGVAGHAGLFSTATDLAVFAQMMLDGGTYDDGRRHVRIASDSAVARFTKRTAGWRALGWETCYGGGSCGRYMSERAFGHTGFTGTSMWIDPDRQSFVIVLTNWVRMRPDGHVPDFLTLNNVRADVADIAALSVIDDPAGTRPMPTDLRADLASAWEEAGTRVVPERCLGT